MTDPRRTFLERVDLGKSRIKNFGGFVFLCGGRNDLSFDPILSVRHLLYNELAGGKHGDIADKLKLAEDIQDWFRGGVYSDLVTFEEHLAGLSDVIVLVVESPGSIAELGAFSISPAITDRLLVLVAEIHYEQNESFIKLGPLKRLEDKNGEAVLVYDWHEKIVENNIERVVERYDKLKSEMPSIVKAIRQFMSADNRERVFKKDDTSHQMLLVCDLIDLFGALPFTEIQEFLSTLSVEVSGDTLKQYLFLLERCGLLRIKAKGHGRYYYCEDWTPRISFGLEAGPAIDKQRLRIDVVEFYDQYEKTRAEILKKIRTVA
jgi:hypothetical protein